MFDVNASPSASARDQNQKRRLFFKLKFVIKHVWSQLKKAVSDRKKRNRNRLMMTEKWWHDFSHSWFLDVSQLQDDYKKWSEELTDGIENSMKYILEHRDKLVTNIEEWIVNEQRFTFIHHVEIVNLSLKHIYRILRAQRTLQKAGHRYILLLYIGNTDINADETDIGAKGNLETLKQLLPTNDQQPMLYVIHKTDIQDALLYAKEPCSASHAYFNSNDTEWRRQCSHYLTAYWYNTYEKDFAINMRNAHGNTNENSTVNMSITEHDGPMSVSTLHNHYWIMDIQSDWIGSLPQVLAKWSTRVHTQFFIGVACDRFLPEEYQKGWSSLSSNDQNKAKDTENSENKNNVNEKGEMDGRSIGSDSVTMRVNGTKGPKKAEATHGLDWMMAHCHRELYRISAIGLTEFYTASTQPGVVHMAMNRTNWKDVLQEGRDYQYLAKDFEKTHILSNASASKETQQHDQDSKFLHKTTSMSDYQQAESEFVKRSKSTIVYTPTPGTIFRRIE